MTTETEVYEEFGSNPFSRMPSYLVAADNHNLASGNFTFVDALKTGLGGVGGVAAGAAVGSVIPGVGTVLGGIVGGILGAGAGATDGKFVAASVLSGANSFYNTGIMISNWFSDEKKDMRETSDWIASFDSNLGAYYEENKLSSELGGFLMGSLIPTTGALKVYNYGSKMLEVSLSGNIGKNFSNATGLLVSKQDFYMKEAVKHFASKDAPLTVLNQNVLKSFAYGAADEALQGAFVSTAVLATMKQSPILSSMDAGDIGWNILEGAALGGVIGGGLRAAIGYGKIGRSVDAAQEAAKPFYFGERLREGNPTANELINAEDIIRSRQIPVEGEENYAFKLRKYEESTRKWEDESRTLSRELAGGDDILGNMTANHLAGIGTSEEVASRILGLQNISRVTVKTKREIDYDKIALKLSKGEEVSTDEFNLFANHSVSYMKNWGEGAGSVVDELTPGTITLADRVGKGKELYVSPSQVDKYKQSTSLKTPWDVLKHSVDENEARYIWAIHPNGHKFLSKPDTRNLIHENDLPLLKGAYLKDAPNVVIKRVDGSEMPITSKDMLFKEVNNSLERYRARMTAANEIPDSLNKSVVSHTPKYTNQEMARRLDATVGYLEGTAVDTENVLNNIFAFHSAAQKYTDRLRGLGRWNKDENIPVYTQPQFSKLVYDNTPVKNVNGNVLEGMAVVKQQQRLAQQAADNIVANIVGPEMFSQMQEFSARQMMTANPRGPGQGFLTGSNQNYGTVGSAMQYLGNLRARLAKGFNDVTKAELEGPLYRLNQDQAAALEWQATQGALRATPASYTLLKDGEKGFGLYLKETTRARDPKAADFIPINNPVTQEVYLSHYKLNGTRVGNSAKLNSANGITSSLSPDTVYPIPVNTSKYPHFAFVVDDTVTGTGHTSMIYAGTADELDNLIAKVRAMPESSHLKVITKGESERYHKAIGDYTADDTISENSINVLLKRNGVSSNFIPKTDPQEIANDILQWHLQKDNQHSRYILTTKYSKEFAELRDLAESHTNLATSRVGAASLSKYIESKVDNPYVDYIKTALDIASLDRIPRWTAFNNFTDQKFSEVYGAVKSIWKKEPPEIAAEQVNAAFTAAGIKTAVYDASLVAHANHTVPSGILQSFVSRSNALLATLVLRMDPLNALNNVVGSPVLTGSELKGLINAIKKNDANIAGELAHIKLPGTSDDILSPTKLYAGAIKNFFSSPESREWAKTHGFSSRHLQEYQSILDDLTLTGKESVKDLESKFKAAYDKTMRIGDLAEKYTGNKLAEEFNRFISANIAKQITDVAVTQGLISEKNALSYINTFVNRTQGNYMASQRPLMFSGPVGSALGLFQTYQFNLAQQMLRHVADGSGKTAALAMGLQSTLYGMHGLPAFDYINAHVIGTMSGNTNHHDLYDATYGSVGKEAGDWLMYGIPSNVLGLIHPDLKMNLYTRGDVNPRYPTIVPTDIENLPIVASSAKFFGSLKNTVSKIADGGNVWTSFLQGIEHAGINRPLAGLAQTLEAFGNPQKQSFSTTNHGSVIAANDLISLANLTRIAGAKPLDEAVAIDAGYRLDAYKNKDLKERKKLGEAIKAAAIGNNPVTEDQVNKFAADYASLGGKQKEFNQFMMNAIKSANTSKANEIMKHLKNPQAESMQRIMGGYDMRDFAIGY